jgi:N-methylhydantoinase A/oxoprolinase/acetone carboxylase beta subunit
LIDAFHRAHEERFGFSRPKARVEAITFRATALGPARDVHLRAPSGSRIGPSETWRISGTDVPVYDRATLPSGARLNGPAIVTEPDSTTWLDPDAEAVVHESGALIVSVS